MSKTISAPGHDPIADEGLRCPDLTCLHDNKPHSTFCARCGRTLAAAYRASPTQPLRRDRRGLWTGLLLCSLSIPATAAALYWRQKEAHEASFRTARREIMSLINAGQWQEVEAQLAALQQGFSEKTAALTELRETSLTGQARQLVQEAADAIAKSQWSSAGNAVGRLKALGLQPQRLADFEAMLVHRLRKAVERLCDEFDRHMDNGEWQSALPLAERIERVFAETGLPDASEETQSVAARAREARDADWRRVCSDVKARLDAWNIEQAEQVIVRAEKVHARQPELATWRRQMGERRRVLDDLARGLQAARTNAALDALAEQIERSALPESMKTSRLVELSQRREQVVWKPIADAFDIASKAGGDDAAVGLAVALTAQGQYQHQRERIQEALTEFAGRTKADAGTLVLHELVAADAPSQTVEILKKDLLTTIYRVLVSENPPKWEPAPRQLATSRVTRCTELKSVTGPTALRLRVAQVMSGLESALERRAALDALALLGRLHLLAPRECERVTAERGPLLAALCDDLKKLCPGCGNRGQVPCRHCDGKGKVAGDIKCPNEVCNGTGSYRCQSCRGNGRVKCVTCDGSGQVSRQTGTRRDGNMRWPVYQTVPCTQCQGGMRNCQPCGGKGGPITCKRCNGAGRIGGARDCEPCGASGMQPCGQCAAAKKTE